MDKNDNIVMISKDIRANERYIRELLADCGDIQIRKMRLGDERKVDCLMVYIEVATSNMMLEDSAIGKMVGHFWEISPGEMQEFVEYNSLGIADVKKLTDMEQVFAGLLAGNAVFFMDGFDQAMKISSVGYPSMGVTEVEMEKVLRGSREGFSDSVKINSALIRKRLRDTRLKVVEFYIGERSHTLVQMVYMEDLVQEEFLEKVATDGDADKYESESGKVTLMTLHSAKGLEFPVVFIPGMEDGLFPGHRAMDSEEGLEEERRLCYVGMTRAKERLFLTSAAYRMLYGQGDYTRESKFLRELDRSVLDPAGDMAYVPTRKAGGSLGIDTGSLDGFAAKPYKPYDPLAHAKKAARLNAEGGEKDLETGDRVRHGKFGEGMVLESDEKTVTVMFDSVGQKKLARGIAPLKKI